MPELPDVECYVHALRDRLTGSSLLGIRISSPFLLRSVAPTVDEVSGLAVTDVSRLGKRIVVHLQDERALVIHLMVAGRFRWAESGAKIPARVGLAAFDFEAGTLLLTEASKKKRASLHLVASAQALQDHDPGGIEVLEVSWEAFDAALRQRNHTLKRTLTDPRVFSGIGNAYSDEILHRAKLSPFKQSQKVSEEESRRLHQAVVESLRSWTDRLRTEFGDEFPGKVTAFRPDMAVHGKFGAPCPECGTPVQRIRYAENEANYCPTCQTDGKLLADRALSRLLKKDWPRTLEELEKLKDETKTRLAK
ncbi:MAG: formamidopyrimidine-DNA glycosylase [Myxococcales bacterium]|nr:formamidopyrimidine-DNA glycosylase [Myxococcales bacterium]